MDRFPITSISIGQMNKGRKKEREREREYRVDDGDLLKNVKKREKEKTSPFSLRVGPIERPNRLPVLST
jgi:hypothetical protein